MSGHHSHLRVRFYPGHDGPKWTCVVQRLGGDGMPIGGDLISATGDTRDDARTHALEQAPDEDVREALVAAH
ncbi:MAG: hypothetical protein ABI051_09435 [Vicinamibacterales bacterium]